MRNLTINGLTLFAVAVASFWFGSKSKNSLEKQADVASSKSFDGELVRKEKRVSFFDLEEPSVYDLATEDSERALEWIHDKYSDSGPEELLTQYGFFAGGLASEDPMAALNWAQSVEDAKLRGHCYSCIFSVWIQDEDVNHQVFLNQLKSHLGYEWATGLLNDGISGIASQDEGQALAWIRENLATDERRYFDSIDEVLRTVGTSDSQKFLAMLSEYETRGEPKEAFSRLVFGIASRKLDAALTILEESGIEGEDKSYNTTRLLSVFIDRDPEAMVSFVSENFPEDWRDILSNNVGEWAKRDSTHFLEWLGNQDTQIQEGVLTNDYAVREIAKKEPAQALKLAETIISDVTAREGSRNLIFSRWSRDDPSKALKWLESQDSQSQQLLVNSFLDAVGEVGSAGAEEYLLGSSILQALWKK